MPSSSPTIGYVAQEVEIGTQTTINVRLQTAVSSLDEVVVIGYGTRTRADLTGAVSAVDAKDIAKSDFHYPRTRYARPDGRCLRGRDQWATPPPDRKSVSGE